MDLPDCPPGAEGYQDSVTEVPKKPEDTSCTKAEQEFQDHLNSLKIKIEDGSYRCMVERRGRDISGKWIYLCYPCAAVCSGEAILQTHVSGKKHKAKLSLRNVWPQSIFTDHPYNQSENVNKMAATPKVLKKMAEEVELFNKDVHQMDQKYGKLKDVRCHIQDTLDEVTAPLIGVEYLVEHPPQEAHYEPSYTCTLCYKQGHPRTIVNHMTCFWHRHNYIQRHFPKAADLLKPFRQQAKYRDGVAFIMNRIAQRVVEKYGRMRPINIDKEEYEKDKERIHQWIVKSEHYCETSDCTFEEVVDIDLINTLYRTGTTKGVKDPSPPVVAAPKPNANRGVGRRERRVSMESVSDLSDDLDRFDRRSPRASRYSNSSRGQPAPRPRYEPYPDKGRDAAPRGKYAALNNTKKSLTKTSDGKRSSNYEYKLQVASERRAAIEDSANKSLAYHEKNPEKHPLYPEEWKKFWNRRYKEIQAEGKDPSKHDFKPEWIVYWTARMKELHREELRLQVVEIYRKMCLTPPPAGDSPPREQDKRRPPDKDARRANEYDRSKDRKRSPEPRRRSPLPFRAEPRRRSPAFRRDHRSPVPHRRSPPRRHSPPRAVRTRSRSPVHSMRSPARTHIVLESRGSRSPLSRRETAHRNRSPAPRRSPPRRSPPRRSPPRRSVPRVSPAPALSARNRSPDYLRDELSRHSSSRNRSPVPSTLNTVLISDDELKPDDGASPWNSGNSLESLGSLPDARSPPSPPRSRAGSTRTVSRQGGGALAPGEAENVVATLRTLVALEDYLGSLGPKVVDLLAEAIRMEKEKANSSEQLLSREPALVLIETAKEKLKGAAQAGLVAPAAAAAVRAAVVRAAATLHEADKRARLKKAESSKPGAKGAGEGGVALPVAGVGAVDRAQIAAQMAAALVAQGKTDVTEEELAQLVDAVVGMAEAKKREADERKQAGGRAGAAGPAAGTASALQMLQSAYDDKRCEKEDATDAMDGLSDSDLETLLKNFNELSAEEQHSLIAYLKKLEAREPQRVERLRQYVSAAAAQAPARAPVNDPAPGDDPPPAAPRPAPADNQPVPIESDDDDYTVEEVFQSVTAKVKEDKIRQEMEIVKKSLEESSVTASEVMTSAPAAAPAAVVLGNPSSAANLLALVQASLQSANASKPPPQADVVASSTQPRSFGDNPEPLPPAAPPTYPDRPQQQPFPGPRQNLTYVANAPNEPPQPNPNVNNDQRFGMNQPNVQNEPRFRGANAQGDQFAGGNQHMQNQPRFGGNNGSAYIDQGYGNNNMAHNDQGYGNNQMVHNDQGYGNNQMALNDQGYGNNQMVHNDQGYGNNQMVHNDQGYGNNQMAHNEQGYGNNQMVHNEPRFGGNNPRMHNEQAFGGNPVGYNEPPPHSGPTWEPRPGGPNINMGPPRDQGYNNNYPQDNSYSGPPDAYNQRPPGGYNNMNSDRMQDNYDARPQNTNQQHQQYGNQNKLNIRGRGGNFGNRGRGRGRGNW